MMAREKASKIVSLAELPLLRARYGAADATIGLCHGCFDILHSGHVYHLARAADEVDVLVVSVTPARFIDKGPGRPIFDDVARVSVLAALGVVDHVVLNDTPTAAALIRALRPDVFFKGSDYLVTDDPRIADERAAVAEVGARHALTDGRITDSSTRSANLLLAAGSGGQL